MLCIVCTSPILNLQYENKLCQSCASQIKPKSDLNEGIHMDIDKLESVQQKLLHDLEESLNLEEDSDYEAELNYLREAKKAVILSKEKNIHSFKPNEVLKVYPHEHQEEVTTIFNFVYKCIQNY